MQNLVRSKSIRVTGNAGRGTAGAGPGWDLLYTLPDTPALFLPHCQWTQMLSTGHAPDQTLGTGARRRQLQDNQELQTAIQVVRRRLGLEQASQLLSNRRLLPSNLHLSVPCLQ